MVGSKPIDESQKEEILLPYKLEVVEVLRGVEQFIRKGYMKSKNSMDLKSLDPQQDIEIIIKENDKGFPELLDTIKKYSYIKKIAEEEKNDEDLNTRLVILILARILGYDRENLWVDIYDNIRKKNNPIICQPFYEFKYYKSREIVLVIKDYIVIPKDFVAAYFGYDTGIDGLRMLMYGGFLLPPDRSAYISVGGEAGIGKTALVVRLITAFFQNYTYKNVPPHEEKEEEKELTKKDAQPLSIHYILMEQNEKNIIRLIKECNLIDPKNSNVISALKDKNENKSFTEDEIKKIIQFANTDMFSPMGLIEKVESIENSKDEENKRKVIVIDSVNAIQEMDINRTEWRELFQSIKAITSKKNTIVFFIMEKNPDQPDFVIEYLSDVVIKLYRDYKEEAFYRVFELVESRFQISITGKHVFYITKPNSGFIRIYPSTTAMGEILPHRKRVKTTEHGDSENRKEVGIKIDGIIHFFKYSHLYQTKMEPFFLKNSISMFIGDRGAHKSAFAKKFALSAFRDERWETPTKYIVEIDYREQEPNKPLDELLTIGFWNARPVEKSISLLLYFSENYDEDPANDTIWETYFGKVIIPGCTEAGGNNYIGHISHIVCLYEVKDFTEDVYIYQLDELIRAIESYRADDSIPETYYDFVNQKSISLIARKRQKDSTDKGKSINFNPFNILYKGNFIKNFKIDLELIDRFIKQEIHIMDYQKDKVKAKTVKELLEELGKQEKIEMLSSGIEKLRKELILEYYDPIIDTIEDFQEIRGSMSLSSKGLQLLKSNLEKIYSAPEKLIPKELIEKKQDSPKTNGFISKVKKDKEDLHKLLDSAFFRKLLESALEILNTKKDEKYVREWFGSALKKSDIEKGGKELKELTDLVLESPDTQKDKKDLKELLKSALNKLDIEKKKGDLKKLLDAVLGEPRTVVLEVSKELNSKVNELIGGVDYINNNNEGGLSNWLGITEAFNLLEEKIHKIDFLRRMLIFQAANFRDKAEERNLRKSNAYNEKELYKMVNDLKGISNHNEKELFNMKLLNPDEIRINDDKEFNRVAFDYQDIDKVKVSRIVLDDAENLDKVYKSLNPPKYISTLAHLCLAGEITLGIVNTRSKDETSEVDTVCNAVSDNAFQFDKFFFKGEMFITFSIIRSSPSFHNNMMYYLSKRDDGLLQLNNTFALLSNVERHNPEPIEIRLFLPDLSKEFSKSMYRILVERDTIDADTNGEEIKGKAFAKQIDYASEFKVTGQQGLEIIYNTRERFPSIYKDWHDFLKDMITYSLAHPNVKVHTANDPFTDFSIILDDESAKDAISILCLPGYLMDLYEKNLATISDYVHFCGDEDHQPVWTHLKDDDKWITFEEENDRGKKYKLGNEFYYLKRAPLRMPEGPRKSEKDGNGNERTLKHRWIVPEILFNPAIARDEDTNRVIMKEYKEKKDQEYLDIKGYPYYIDPRVNLVFSTEDSCVDDESELNYFVHNDAHDFVALFFELWFDTAINKIDECKHDHKGRHCKDCCNFCFFEQATKEVNREHITTLVEKFIKHVKKSVFFNHQGLAKNIKQWYKGDKQKPIVLREWYSSAQQKLKVLGPLFSKLGIQVHVKLKIPTYFLYTTWYLAIPVNSPRKDTASEIIIKMTEPHDLAHHQITGIGLQLDERFYDKSMDKFYPEYEYSEVLKAMENLIEDKQGFEKVGIPIASNHCYFENLTLLGGFLGDFYRSLRNYCLF